MRNTDNDIVPDPANSPSYAGLNEQLLAQRQQAEAREDVKTMMAAFINDHTPVQPNRYEPKVRCLTPACNFHGTFLDHSRHVAELILKELDR